MTNIERLASTIKTAKEFTLTDEIRQKLIKLIRDAHQTALHSNSMCGETTVWLDMRDNDVWINYNNDVKYRDDEIICVCSVEPYTLEEIYDDDPELENNPEEFEDWYLHDEDTGLCARSHILNHFETETLPAYIKELENRYCYLTQEE